MNDKYLTIKRLTKVVGGGLTPRMVRHYHQIGLLPPARRSPSNYRLYTEEEVRRLRQIVALKEEGFQLEQIRKLLEANPQGGKSEELLGKLQQQYRFIIEKLIKLRQTASALERILGRDISCQMVQSEAIAKLPFLDLEKTGIDELWDALDAVADSHPEEFEESLQHILPDLSDRSEIEAHLLSKLALASGDITIVHFARVGKGAIAAARDALKSGCQIVADVPAIAAAFDATRLAHLGCTLKVLIDNPHIASAAEAEREFPSRSPLAKLSQLAPGCIVVVGYAPSVLMSVCSAIESGQLQPALAIAMPIGFSHAPAAKRRLQAVGTPFITVDGTIGGGLLAAVALNALAESTIEKPDCHCYLNSHLD